MIKEFLDYNTVRNNALKIAHKIYKDGFIPDVIYCSLRGGAAMANVISEYFKIVCRAKNYHPVLYAGVVARSYSDIAQHTQVFIDGWTYPPENLRPGDKILLVDDIYDSGRTINCLVETLMNMMCKYYWCAGYIKEPPHLPIDRSNLTKAGIKGKDMVNWTQIEDKNEYKSIIDKIRKKLGSQSLAEWEIVNWKRKSFSREN